MELKVVACTKRRVVNEDIMRRGQVITETRFYPCPEKRFVNNLNPSPHSHRRWNAFVVL